MLPQHCHYGSRILLGSDVAPRHRRYFRDLLWYAYFSLPCKLESL